MKGQIKYLVSCILLNHTGCHKHFFNHMLIPTDEISKEEIAEYTNLGIYLFIFFLNLFIENLLFICHYGLTYSLNHIHDESS